MNFLTQLLQRATNYGKNSINSFLAPANNVRVRDVARELPLGVSSTYDTIRHPVQSYGNYFNSLMQPNTKTINFNNHQTQPVQPARINAQPVARNNQQLSIEDMVKNTFGNNAPMALAIMKAESQGDPTRIGDKDKMFVNNGENVGDSVGLFQIRTGGNEGGQWNRAKANGIPAYQFRNDMLQPDQNIRYAKQVYDRNGWNPWSTYLNGTYKKYLN